MALRVWSPGIRGSQPPLVGAIAMHAFVLTFCFRDSSSLLPEVVLLAKFPHRNSQDFSPSWHFGNLQFDLISPLYVELIQYISYLKQFK